MPNTTIEKIEEKIRTNSSLNDENKNELLKLISGLKAELEGLSGEHVENAERIISHIDSTTDEAFKESQDHGLLKKALEGLSDSVREFEVSHPKLVAQIDFIASKLANSGI